MATSKKASSKKSSGKKASSKKASSKPAIEEVEIEEVEIEEVEDEVEDEDGTETVEADEKNIPIWEVEYEDGTSSIVSGLCKAHFLNEDVAQADRKDAKISFTKYMIALKEISKAGLETKIARMDDTIEVYKEKLDVLVNGESPETSVLRKKASLERQMRAVLAKMADMNLNDDDDDDDEDEDDDA